MFEAMDTMDNPPTYEKGDIVWVKLSGYWWPGEVKKEEDLPSDLLKDFKKPPLVIVKFFEEDSYEYIKQWSNIYPYNCVKKAEFIKKGMGGFRAKLSHMATFPRDIGTAEEKTNGDPNILSQPEFLPNKKINLDEIFGSPSPKKTPKGKPISSKKSISKDNKAPLITHRRFLGNDDYKAFVYIQQVGKDRQPDSDDEEILKLNEEPKEVLTCESCGFNTRRLGVLVMHNKLHLEGAVYVPTKKKIKKAREGEQSGSEAEATVVKTPKPKQRKKKTPKLELETSVESKPVDNFANLLEEWNETDDEIDSATKHATGDKKMQKAMDQSLNNSLDAPNQSDKSKSGEQSKVNTQEDIKNCFDFDEEEEDDDFLYPASKGRKIPRVIPEKPKASISELLELSEKEEQLGKGGAPKLPAPKDTTEDRNKEILRVNQSVNKAPVPENTLDSAFKELLEETEMPLLDHLSQSLKSEQNFHDVRTIKFPDKGGTTAKTPVKSGTSKRRFVTSFDGFQAGFRKVNVDKNNDKEESAATEKEIQARDSDQNSSIKLASEQLKVSTSHETIKDKKRTRRKIKQLVIDEQSEELREIFKEDEVDNFDKSHDEYPLDAELQEMKKVLETSPVKPILQQPADKEEMSLEQLTRELEGSTTSLDIASNVNEVVVKNNDHEGMARRSSRFRKSAAIGNVSKNEKSSGLEEGATVKENSNHLEEIPSKSSVDPAFAIESNDQNLVKQKPRKGKVQKSEKARTELVTADSEMVPSDVADKPEDTVKNIKEIEKKVTGKPRRTTRRRHSEDKQTEIKPETATDTDISSRTRLHTNLHTSTLGTQQAVTEKTERTGDQKEVDTTQEHGENVLNITPVNFEPENLIKVPEVSTTTMVCEEVISEPSLAEKKIDVKGRRRTRHTSELKTCELQPISDKHEKSIEKPQDDAERKSVLDESPLTAQSKSSGKRRRKRGDSETKPPVQAVSESVSAKELASELLPVEVKSETRKTRHRSEAITEIKPPEKSSNIIPEEVLPTESKRRRGRSQKQIKAETKSTHDVADKAPVNVAFESGQKLEELKQSPVLSSANAKEAFESVHELEELKQEPTPSSEAALHKPASSEIKSNKVVVETLTETSMQEKVEDTTLSATDAKEVESVEDITLSATGSKEIGAEDMTEKNAHSVPDIALSAPTLESSMDAAQIPDTNETASQSIDLGATEFSEVVLSSSAKADIEKVSNEPSVLDDASTEVASTRGAPSSETAGSSGIENSKITAENLTETSDKQNSTLPSELFMVSLEEIPLPETPLQETPMETPALDIRVEDIPLPPTSPITERKKRKKSEDTLGVEEAKFQFDLVNQTDDVPPSKQGKSEPKNSENKSEVGETSDELEKNTRRRTRSFKPTTVEKNQMTEDSQVPVASVTLLDDIPIPSPIEADKTESNVYVGEDQLSNRSRRRTRAYNARNVQDIPNTNPAGTASVHVTADLTDIPIPAPIEASESKVLEDKQKKKTPSSTETDITESNVFEDENQSTNTSKRRTRAFDARNVQDIPNANPAGTASVHVTADLTDIPIPAPIETLESKVLEDKQKEKSPSSTEADKTESNVLEDEDQSTNTSKRRTRAFDARNVRDIPNTNPAGAASVHVTADLTDIPIPAAIEASETKVLEDKQKKKTPSSTEVDRTESNVFEDEDQSTNTSKRRTRAFDARNAQDIPNTNPSGTAAVHVTADLTDIPIPAPTEGSETKVLEDKQKKKTPSSTEADKTERNMVEDEDQSTNMSKRRTRAFDARNAQDVPNTNSAGTTLTHVTADLTDIPIPAPIEASETKVLEDKQKKKTPSSSEADKTESNALDDEDQSTNTSKRRTRAFDARNVQDIPNTEPAETASVHVTADLIDIPIPASESKVLEDKQKKSDRRRTRSFKTNEPVCDEMPHMEYETHSENLLDDIPVPPTIESSSLSQHCTVEHAHSIKCDSIKGVANSEANNSVELIGPSPSLADSSEKKDVTNKDATDTGHHEPEAPALNLAEIPIPAPVEEPLCSLPKDNKVEVKGAKRRTRAFKSPQSELDEGKSTEEGIPHIPVSVSADTTEESQMVVEDFLMRGRRLTRGSMAKAHLILEHPPDKAESLNDIPIPSLPHVSESGEKEVSTPIDKKRRSRASKLHVEEKTEEISLAATDGAAKTDSPETHEDIDPNRDPSICNEGSEPKLEIPAVTGIVSEKVYRGNSTDMRKSGRQKSRSRWDVVVPSESEQLDADIQSNNNMSAITVPEASRENESSLPYSDVPRRGRSKKKSISESEAANDTIQESKRLFNSVATSEQVAEESRVDSDVSSSQSSEQPSAEQKDESWLRSTKKDKRARLTKSPKPEPEAEDETDSSKLSKTTENEISPKYTQSLEMCRQEINKIIFGDIVQESVDSVASIPEHDASATSLPEQTQELQESSSISKEPADKEQEPAQTSEVTPRRRGRPRKPSKTIENLPECNTTDNQENTSKNEETRPSQLESDALKDSSVPPKKNKRTRLESEFNNEESQIENISVEVSVSSIGEAKASTISVTKSEDSGLILPPKKSKRVNEVSTQMSEDSSLGNLSSEFSFQSFDDSIMSTALRNNIEGIINDMDLADTSVMESTTTSVDTSQSSLGVLKEISVPPKKKKLDVPVAVSEDLGDNSSKPEEKVESIPQAPKKKMQKLFEKSQILEKVEVPLMSPLAKKKSFLFQQDVSESTEESSITLTKNSSNVAKKRKSSLHCDTPSKKEKIDEGEFAVAASEQRVTDSEISGTSTGQETALKEADNDIEVPHVTADSESGKDFCLPLENLGLSLVSEPELVPISGTPTVMSEKDLADVQVEITSDKVISESKLTSTPPGNFPEATAATLGTEFTSKAMLKEFDNKPLMSQPNAYVLKSELLDILEGNSNSSTNSSGSEQKFKTSFDNYNKRKSTVHGIIDFEDAIPSQIVNKGPTDNVLVESPKLLERLSMTPDATKTKPKAPIPQTDVKASEQSVGNLTKSVSGVPKPGQKIVIRTTKPMVATPSKPGGTKPIILSEQIIRPANSSTAVSKPPIQGVKRDYEDIEDVEAAFIISKIAKPVVEEEAATAPSQPEKVKTRSPKGGKKPKIIQQTIISASGELVPSSKTAVPSTTTATPVQLFPTKVAQAKPAHDDNVFDINSMPIVLSDDLLTPESIQNMPVVLSGNVLPATRNASVTSAGGAQEKVVAGVPMKTVASVIGTKQIIFKTTQPTSSIPVANKTTVKVKNVPSAVTTTHNKIVKGGTTAFIATGTTADGKPAKYVLVPPSVTPATTQIKSVKQAVIKKPPTTQAKAPLQPAVTIPPSEPTQAAGNKIMIVTNAQGQQTRVVLTPQQQKVFMQAQTGAKTMAVIKSAIPKALLESAGVSTQAGPSGVVPKTNDVVTQVALAQPAAAPTGLLMPAVKSVKAPAPLKKAPVRSSKPQKTILIKNQLGQTVRKIQGTDDADLDRQVAEQLEAIRASARLQQANKTPEIINYTNRAIPNSTSAANKQTIRKSYSKKIADVNKAKGIATSDEAQKKQDTTVPALAPLSPQSRLPQVPSQPPKQLVKKVTESVSRIPVSRAAEQPHVVGAKQEIKSAASTSAKVDKSGESKRPESPLRQVVIQDGLGNLTTVTVGQILAIPSETVDGQPQSYMLVTVDESGNLTPLNNDALMSLDPSLGAGGDLNNVVLQVDQGHGTVAAVKPTSESGILPDIAVPIAPKPKQIEERLKPNLPKPVPQPSAPPKQAQTGQPKTKNAPIPVEQPVVVGDGITPGVDPGGQQLIVTGDPVATQKLLESLSDGSTDLASLLASAEDGNVLVQVDGQQILIRTNPTAQPVLGVGGIENAEVNNQLLASHKPNQDILAAALANTDVFQSTEQVAIQSSIGKSPATAQLSPVGGSGLFPMQVGNVLETSLTLSSPIMTPLEVPSTNSKKIDDEADVLGRVPKNVDLPITITDPNIAQTVAHPPTAALMELSLPIPESGPVGDINSPSFSFSLSGMEDSVTKPFNGSMPLLTEDVMESQSKSSISSFSPNFGSLPLLESVESSSSKEEGKSSNFGDVSSLPMLSDDGVEDSSSSIGSTKLQRTSPKTIEHEIIDEGLSTLGGEMCSSLSEPPPDMFDLSALAPKEEEISSDISSIPEQETLSTNSENSVDIPLQAPIVASLSDLKRPGDEDSEGSDEKRQRTD